MSPRPRPTLRAWRSRFRRLVAEGFLVRFHMALMLGAVAATGVISSGLLALAGLERLILRLPLAVLVSYATFFLLVRLWISYVHSSAPPSLQEPALAATLILATADARASRPSPGARVQPEDVVDAADAALDGADAIGAVGDLGSADDGAVLLLFGLVLLGIFAAGGWLIWQAPFILGEAAFSAVLAGAVRRSTPDAEETTGWARKLFRHTAAAFTVVACLAALAGFAAEVACPGAVTLRAALACPPPG